MSKKTVSVISACVGLVLMGAVAGVLASALGQTGRTYTYGDFVCAIALTMTAFYGIYYITAGCKKGRGSRYYVSYMGALTVCDLLMITGASGLPVLCTGCLAVSVAANTVLCFAKDLGQNRSTAFALLALAAKLAVLIVSLARGEAFSMNAAAGTVLSAAALFMVGAKYYDKSLRGSK